LCLFGAREATLGGFGGGVSGRSERVCRPGALHQGAALSTLMHDACCCHATSLWAAGLCVHAGRAHMVWLVTFQHGRSPGAPRLLHRWRRSASSARWPRRAWRSPAAASQSPRTPSRGSRRGRAPPLCHGRMCGGGRICGRYLYSEWAVTPALGRLRDALRTRQPCQAPSILACDLPSAASLLAPAGDPGVRGQGH